MNMSHFYKKKLQIRNTHIDAIVCKWVLAKRAGGFP